MGLYILAVVISLALVSACNTKQQKAKKAVENFLQSKGNNDIREMSVDLFHPGRYSMHVSVSRNGHAASINGEIDVPPAAPPWAAYWPYFALVPAAILLFALNQWLKAKRDGRRH